MNNNSSQADKHSDNLMCFANASTKGNVALAEMAYISLVSTSKGSDLSDRISSANHDVSMLFIKLAMSSSEQRSTTAVTAMEQGSGKLTLNTPNLS